MRRHAPLHIVGIPKGNLYDSTMAAINRIDWLFLRVGRSVWLEGKNSNFSGLMLKPFEIVKFLASGRIGCGFAGSDTVAEMVYNGDINAGDILVFKDLGMSKDLSGPARWVLAAPEEGPLRSLDDLRSRGGDLVIASEIPRIARKWLEFQQIDATVELSCGSTEGKAPHFVDAIIDCTHSGDTLRANGQKIITTVFESSTCFLMSWKVASQNVEWAAATVRRASKLGKRS